MSEGDRIVVTSAQVMAARMQVELAKELGRTVSPLVRRIAEAKVRPKGRRVETTAPSIEDRPDALTKVKPASA